MRRTSDRASRGTYQAVSASHEDDIVSERAVDPHVVGKDDAAHNVAGQQSSQARPDVAVFKTAVAAKRIAKGSGDHGVYCAYRNVAPSPEMVVDPGSHLSYTMDDRRL
jgi:hypothetical protein